MVRAVRLGKLQRERLVEEAHNGRVVVGRMRGVEPAAHFGEVIGRDRLDVDLYSGVDHASPSSFVTRWRLRE